MDSNFKAKTRDGKKLYALTKYPAGKVSLSSNCSNMGKKKALSFLASKLLKKEDIQTTWKSNDC